MFPVQFWVRDMEFDIYYLNLNLFNSKSSSLNQFTVELRMLRIFH